MTGKNKTKQELVFWKKNTTDKTLVRLRKEKREGGNEIINIKEDLVIDTTEIQNIMILWTSIWQQIV
jgi:hypothetical protein